MSTFFLRHFIFSLTLFSLLNFTFGFILHITKDISSLQYLTHVRHGAPPVPIKLVIDLNGPFSWSDCSSSSSASHRPIHFRSLQCSTANTNGSGVGSVKSRASTECGFSMKNPISQVNTWGGLVEVIVAVDLPDRSQIDEIATVDQRILSYCTPTLFLQGLSSGAKGVLGLGNTRMAFQSQLAMLFGLDRRFSICLSSSRGFINIGSWSHMSMSAKSKIDVSRFLTYTPLVSKSSDGDDNEKGEYFINVKAIAINGQRILLPRTRGKALRAKISTLVPYTIMESSIYEAFVKAYIVLASSMNMTRVFDTVKLPFSVCFKSENITDKKTMPNIDLILQSEMVKWRITESNSLVKVDDELTCLGFVDGGSNTSSSIVIGGYQLEDNFLQFDAATSMLGFSSSLLDRGLTCSNLEHYSTLS